MIKNIGLVASKTKLNDATKKYVEKRIGKLDKFLPRHAKKTVLARVHVKEVGRAHGNKYEVEVVLDVPGKTITAKDEAGNVLSAIDILEVKLATQLRRYKAEAHPYTGKKRLLSRLKIRSKI
ncbi:ribosome-associated translation inhibitor RaiA [Candidatus Saccharibacteria bacterium]|nr:ribosome-associated translation inhibitor RaiA [Candidatus Saccharibacteria bacterium]